MGGWGGTKYRNGRVSFYIGCSETLIKKKNEWIFSASVWAKSRVDLIFMGLEVSAIMRALLKKYNKKLIVKGNIYLARERKLQQTINLNTLEISYM